MVTKRVSDVAFAFEVNHRGINVLGAPEYKLFAETCTEDHTFDLEMGASHTTSAMKLSPQPEW